MHLEAQELGVPDGIYTHELADEANEDFSEYIGANVYPLAWISHPC